MSMARCNPSALFQLTSMIQLSVENSKEGLRNKENFDSLTFNYFSAVLSPGVVYSKLLAIPPSNILSSYSKVFPEELCCHSLQ